MVEKKDLSTVEMLGNLMVALKAYQMVGLMVERWVGLKDYCLVDPKDYQ